jgi:hypothetical protein
MAVERLFHTTTARPNVGKERAQGPRLREEGEDGRRSTSQWAMTCVGKERAQGPRLREEEVYEARVTGRGRAQI